MNRFQTSVLMLGFTLFLGASGLGYLAVPGVGGALTVMHIPAVLAGVMDGPLGGAVVGLAFGIISWAYYPPPSLVVQLPPRLLIGVVAAYTFAGVHHLARGSSARTSLAALVAGLAGSLTNTLGITALALTSGLYEANQLVPMAAFHGSVEMLLCALVTVPITVLVYTQRRLRR